jgi:peptidoglycan hydrolase-like protein with peptidoglycan-binding domain
LFASLSNEAKGLHGGPLIRWLIAAGAAIACLAFLACPAFADAPQDKRVALVIGNGAYQSAPKLDNAAFDARAVAGAFRKLGFIVVDGYDLDIAEMRAKVSEFSADLPDAKSAVIYYAGHGISVDEENYLIPTDIVLKSATDLDLGAIGVSLLLKQMKREDRVNVVVLDACRDNPFAATLARNRTRAIVGERGLSRIDGDLARGTLIAFASDPKSTALDGPPGQHSPFTEAFLKHVADPGVSIDTVMSRVRTEVWERTRHNQLPWVNTSLIGDYALNPEPASAEGGIAKPEEPRPAAGAGRETQEDLLWESAQHSNLAGDYKAYLDAFPNGFFARMARNRIASLENAPALSAAAAKVPGTAAAPSAARAQETVATVEPAAPSEQDWKAEFDTADTERALGLTPAAQKEIQIRLTALGYKAPGTGVFDASTRAAISEWQKSRGAALSSFLGPLQLTELRAESEGAYQKLLAAQAAPRSTVRQAAKPATRAAKPAEARALAKEPAREPAKTQARHLAREPFFAPAAPAPAPTATAVCNGNPIWCRHAGLPVDAPEPGRPPGF